LQGETVSKKTRSNRSKQSPFSNPTVMVAVIGGIVTLIGALISVSPQLFQLIRKPTETPIPTLTVTVSPTSPPSTTPTEVLATETATQIPPTSTNTVTPSPTPVDPGIACLDRWEVISSDESLAVPEASGGCSNASVPKLGISTSGQLLIFAPNSFRTPGVFGISTSLPVNAKISMKVTMNSLREGEFWIALSNNPAPGDHMLIFALQPVGGELRTYVNQSRNYIGQYLWSNLTENTTYGAGPPYVYDISLTTSGGLTTYNLNSLQPQSQSVNLPKYLFLGFRKKTAENESSVSMNILVSGLKIDLNQ
jgi:hypothetical protein